MQRNSTLMGKAQGGLSKHASVDSISDAPAAGGGRRTIKGGVDQVIRRQELEMAERRHTDSTRNDKGDHEDARVTQRRRKKHAQEEEARLAAYCATQRTDVTQQQRATARGEATQRTTARDDGDVLASDCEDTRRSLESGHSWGLSSPGRVLPDRHRQPPASRREDVTVGSAKWKRDGLNQRHWVSDPHVTTRKLSDTTGNQSVTSRWRPSDDATVGMSARGGPLVGASGTTRRQHGTLRSQRSQSVVGARAERTGRQHCTALPR